ncbi:DUF998 domain-containing protein [Jatrophihabitans endophyticus]|uniref:DUF998 domain-containing protein n=1 Tax=Jatrophihabitans endophyticus TaxID=1206085 RepID=UPI0019FE2E16|nr:DUF998 domain-containing protein [Jatrophihabitans endophyticus]MBE7186710.1 DUF998 domain-containing protein [Jatrophihabitans endophyticus]
MTAPVRDVAARPRAPHRRPALVLTGAMILVLLGGWLAADALQPSTYSPLHQTISVAAGRAGTDRWVGTAALLAIGVGYLLCATLLPVPPWRGRLGMLATGACGVGVALCPEAATGPTAAHELFSVLGAVLLAAGPLFTMRVGAGSGDKATVPVALRPSVAVAVCVVFTALTAFLVYELNAGNAAGFAERLAVTAETAWPLVVAVSRLDEIDNQCH